MSEPPSDRSVAGPRLRALLGLEAGADETRVRSVSRRLRAHIAARARASQDAAFREARLDELRALDAALPPGVRGSGRDAARDPAGRFGGRGMVLAIGLAFLAGLAWAGLGLFAYQMYSDWRARNGSSQSAGASISARSDPPGGLLTVEHAEAGTIVGQFAADGSPVFLEAGPYALRVDRADCPEPWQQDIEVGNRGHQPFLARICAGSGRVVVESSQPSSRVRIDGLDVGASGDIPHPLGVGDHVVQVDKTGFEPWQGRVRVLPDQQVSLLAELVPVPSGSAGTAATPPPTPALALGLDPALDAQRGGNAAGEGDRLPERSGTGGSKSWHDAMRDRLVIRYDKNGSGSLDTRAEVLSVPCQEWQAIEASYKTGGLRVAMTHLYGFDGSEAPANTLGITEPMRPYAYDRMKQCGLEARL